MHDEHEHMNQLVLAFESEAEDHDRAARLFAECKQRILEHIETEETVLFPIFEKYTRMGRNDGIQARMLRDHGVIKKLIEDTEQVFETEDIKQIKLAANNLGRALRAHEKRESAITYPVSDKVITPEEWKKLFTSKTNVAENVKVVE